MLFIRNVALRHFINNSDMMRKWDIKENNN